MAHERVTLVRRTAGHRPARSATARSTASWRASCSSGTRSCTASGRPGTTSSHDNRSCSRRPRSSSTGPGGATSWSTSTRSSTSTTPASAPTWSAARTSTSGGRRSGSAAPDLLTFDPAMLTHDAADEVTRGRTTPSSGQPTAGPDLPVSYHFEPGAADDGLTIDVPVATLNRVGAEDFSWNVPGLREELVTEPDPEPAQEPPRQLRPGAQQGTASSWPPCRRGRSRCSTRSSATCAPRPACMCRARPGTGRKVAAAPAPDLPRRRRRRATSRRAARTSTRSRRRCDRGSTQAMAEVAADSGWRAPARRRGRSASSMRRRPATPGRPRGRGATRPRRRGRRRSGSRSSASAEERDARHRLGVDRLLLHRLVGDATRRRARSTGSPTTRSCGWQDRRTPRSQTLLDRLPPRGRDRRGRRRADPRSSARSSSTTRCCRAPDATHWRRAPHQCSCRTCCACWPTGTARPTGRSADAPSSRTLPALSDMQAQLAPAGARRLRRRGRRRRSCGAIPRTCRDPASTRAARRERPRGRRDRAADRPGAAAAGGLPAPRRRAPRRTPARRRAAPGALDARGVPGLAVGPAARHRRQPVSDHASASCWTCASCPS